MNGHIERRNRLLRMIAEGMAGIRRELEKATAGAEALDGPQELLFIESKLSEMQEILGREDWRSCSKIQPGIARLVVDTWPMEDPLGNLLSQIEYEYERLK